jgi:hypothetical protein
LSRFESGLFKNGFSGIADEDVRKNQISDEFQADSSHGVLWRWKTAELRLAAKIRFVFSVKESDLFRKNFSSDIEFCDFWITLPLLSDCSLKS